MGLWLGLKGVPSNLSLAASPQAVLTRDRRAALTIWFGYAIGIGLILSAGVQVLDDDLPVHRQRRLPGRRGQRRGRGFLVGLAQDEVPAGGRVREPGPGEQQRHRDSDGRRAQRPDAAPE